MAGKLTWDERYARGDHPGPEPDAFLSGARALIDAHLPRRGRALDLAGGAGRNAVYLASLGFDVTLVDASEAGLARAAELAASRGVTLRVAATDLERGDYVPPENSFDLVAVFFYLHRPLLPAIRAAIRPGGLIVYRTYAKGHPRKMNPEHLLEPSELPAHFHDFRVLRHEESAGFAALVAMKPAIIGPSCSGGPSPSGAG